MRRRGLRWKVAEARQRNFFTVHYCADAPIHCRTPRARGCEVANCRPRVASRNYTTNFRNTEDLQSVHNWIIHTWRISCGAEMAGACNFEPSEIWKDSRLAASKRHANRSEKTFETLELIKPRIALLFPKIPGWNFWERAGGDLGHRLFGWGI